jgi:hypothetical protein
MRRRWRASWRQGTEYGKHRDLLQALATARNDVDVLERAMKAESERPFDLLAAKMAVQ